MFIQDLIEQKMRRVRAQEAKRTARDIAIGLGIGATLGAAAGILLAPKSGKETREDIAAGAKEVIDQVKDQVEEVGKVLKKEMNDEELSKDIKTVTKKVEAKAKDVKSKVNKVVAEKPSASKKSDVA
jgi:gas vesicle protein